MLHKNFIVLDIETTGLSPQNCEITEIGAIKVDWETGEIIDEFSTLINIEGDVPPFITNLTGITKQMLVNVGTNLKEALVNLTSFCEDLPVYAHNSRFDKSFIRHYLEVHNVDFKETEWIDTISIFKEHIPGRSSYKLEGLIKDFNLAIKEDHRAISDASHTFSLLKIAANK